MSASIHARGDLLGRDRVGLGYLLEGAVPAAELACPADTAERAPRQERDPVLRAVPQFSLAGPERRRELVLHAGQVAVTQDAAGDVYLLDAGVGDASQPDLPLVEQFLQSADRPAVLAAQRRIGRPSKRTSARMSAAPLTAIHHSGRPVSITLTMDSA